MGLDGVNKMSKSRDNYIPMTGDPDEIRRLLQTAFTDKSRVYRKDPGHPEPCNVCQLHRVFSHDYEAIWEGERTAATGCVDVKKLLAERIIDYFAPMRERRLELEADPGYVESDLADLARARARAVARERAGSSQGSRRPPPAGVPQQANRVLARAHPVGLCQPVLDSPEQHHAYPAVAVGEGAQVGGRCG